MRFSITVLTLLAVLTLSACQATPIAGAAVSGETRQGESQTAILWVKGLACPFCVHNVDKQLKRVPGVTAVHIELETGKVVVGISGDSPATEEELRDAIGASGFTLDRVEMP